MSTQQHDENERIPLRVTRQIDALCDEFESSLNRNELPSLTTFLDRLDEAGRKQLLKELVALSIEELVRQGVDDPPACLLEANRELTEELKPLLECEALKAMHVPGDAGAVPGHGFHVRCPHCHNPIELVPDADLESIQCPSCGSDFSLVGDDLATRDADTVSEVGHFKLVERVGMGAFGSVWKAHDTQLDRTVAVKIPRKGQLDEKQEKAFLREAQNVAQLSHPGIVPVHEVGRDGDTMYIVSDFVRGIDLAGWLTGQQPTLRESAELCAKIADSLHHAHERRVIHRDLKPANIMLDGEGEPYLMDFGMAKREAGEITMTWEGQVLGTPAYMSPEQAKGDAHHADRRSDIYSLGTILFELLTGERPFRGNTQMLLYQKVTEEAPSPRSLNNNIPRDLETVCLKCLEKDPGQRYLSARDLADDLRRFVKGEPTRARPPGSLRRLWRWANRGPAEATAVLGVSLMLVIGITLCERFIRSDVVPFQHANSSVRLLVEVTLPLAVAGLVYLVLKIPRVLVLLSVVIVVLKICFVFDVWFW